MWRSILLAVLALAALAAPAQARLIKEMEVTRSGKLTGAGDEQTGPYTLVLDNNKTILLGERENFGPGTRAVLDQAIAQKLAVDITGHLLIFNDQSPMFALPLKKIEVKGLKPQSQSAPSAPQQAAQATGGPEADAFKAAMLKSNKALNVGLALESYAYFSNRAWKVVEPGKTAEFRAEINLDDYTEQDSKLVSKLKSKDLRDTFRSLTIVVPMTMVSQGVVDSPEPFIEAVYQDGSKDRLVWKEPVTYYWERIGANKKIKIDYFLGRAAANPKYGKGSSASN